MKNKKALLYFLLSIILIGLIVMIIYFFSRYQNQKNNEDFIITSPTPISNVNVMTEQEKSIFNSNFDMYLGKSVTAIKVKSLISTINSSNQTTSIQKVTIFINDEECTDASKITSSSTYSVSFDYNKNGLIYKAILNEN